MYTIEVRYVVLCLMRQLLSVRLQLTVFGGIDLQVKLDAFSRLVGLKTTFIILYLIHACTDPNNTTTV